MKFEMKYILNKSNPNEMALSNILDMTVVSYNMLRSSDDTTLPELKSTSCDCGDTIEFILSTEQDLSKEDFEAIFKQELFNTYYG